MPRSVWCNFDDAISILCFLVSILQLCSVVLDLFPFLFQAFPLGLSTNIDPNSLLQLLLDSANCNPDEVDLTLWLHDLFFGFRILLKLVNSTIFPFNYSSSISSALIRILVSFSGNSFGWADQIKSQKEQTQGLADLSADHKKQRRG